MSQFCWVQAKLAATEAAAAAAAVADTAAQTPNGRSNGLPDSIGSPEDPWVAQEQVCLSKALGPGTGTLLGPL